MFLMFEKQYTESNKHGNSPTSRIIRMEHSCEFYKFNDILLSGVVEMGNLTNLTVKFVKFPISTMLTMLRIYRIYQISSPFVTLIKIVPEKRFYQQLGVITCVARTFTMMQVKSTLCRVAQSALGWYQLGPA